MQRQMRKPNKKILDESFAKVAIALAIALAIKKVNQRMNMVNNIKGNNS